MTYTGFGQIPTNGGYSARRTGVFGQGPGQTVFVNPPTFDDGGLLRITPSSAPAFEWSINSTTNMDVNLGASMTQVEPETFHLEVASGIGDQWLDVYKQAGYVVLFQMNAELGSKLHFYVTKSPHFIAENAKASAGEIAVVGGNEAIIGAAKLLLAGGALPELPPDVPAPTGLCPEGQIGIPPFCVSAPQLPPTPVEPPFPGGVEPEPTPAPVPAPEPAPTPTPAPVTKAEVGPKPGWIIAGVIAVGAIVAYGAYAMREVRE